ncbi:MAG: RNA polymerase-binding protein RbpA [Angustibacter sp.]
MSEKTLRGTRLGSQSLESEEGVEPAARTEITYECPRGHETVVPFSVEAAIPALWTCKCGSEAVRVDGQRPAPQLARPVRTHWDMLAERRSVPELEVILQERLALLRAKNRATMRAGRQRKSA